MLAIDLKFENSLVGVEAKQARLGTELWTAPGRAPNRTRMGISTRTPPVPFCGSGEVQRISQIS